MRKLLRKLILWALDGVLDPVKSTPVVHDAAGMDAEIRKVKGVA